MRRITRLNIFIAFAFTVMADPVSSVAYAIQAADGALDGRRTHLLPTMALVVAIIAVVTACYHQLIARFPAGGGGAEALASAFGEGWAFLPVGALLVDFTLTITVSCAAGTSALIAYVPALAGWRIPLAVGLVTTVALIMLVGHRGRVAFATATLAFVAIALVVIIRGATVPEVAGSPPAVGDGAFLPVLLAMPLGMALATGVEAPSNAIAQLGQFGDQTRRRFGQATLWLMLLIVGGLTLSLTLLGVRLAGPASSPDSTMLADIARRATHGDAMFGTFQLASLLLLLAAAASSFMAGSGLLKALATHGRQGLVPARLGHVNRFYVPPAGIALLALVSGVIVTAAGGRDQQIVQYYAIAVFASFLGATVAAAVLAWRDRRLSACAVAVLGAALVTLVLVLNLRRGTPAIALVVSLAISAGLYRSWVTRGRPSGVTTLAREHHLPAPIAPGE